MESISIQNLIRTAGLAQMMLVLGSLGVPAVLQWRLELAKVQPLIRQMFWTYAGYILVTNLCFGLVSIFAYTDLLDGSRLATLLNGFITTYWVSRVLVQFFYFDRTHFPKGNWHKIAELILTILFIGLSLVYSLAFYINLQML